MAPVQVRTPVDVEATLWVGQLSGTDATSLVAIEPVPTGMVANLASQNLQGAPTEAGEITTVILYTAAGYDDVPTGDPVEVTVFPWPEVELELGTAATVPVWELSEAPDQTITDMEGIPPGMSRGVGNRTITGTPTELGTYTVRLFTSGGYGDVPIGAPVLVAVVEADEEEPGGPGEPGEPGEDADPWDEWGDLSTALGRRVAAFVGRPGDDDVIATAEAQLPVVAEYVRGYTRGRGFEDDVPASPLRAVIVSGTARLATNPEQLTVFTTGDYSERPAQLAGWTLTELGVLRRYRRVTA